MNFYGRKEELKEFLPYLKIKSALLAVTGRRRIGKSSLIEEFANQQNIPFYSLSGLHPSKKLNKTQLENFCEKVSIKTGQTFSHNNWNSALYSLARILSQIKTKKILLLDEISWMSSDNDGFLEVLKTVWDEEFKKDNIMVFICGSVSSWIYDNIVNSSNFRGRLSNSAYQLSQMNLKDCNLFWNNYPHISSVEKMKMLSIIGGIPKYLELIIPSATTEQNIQRLCYSKSGYLFKEFDQYFYDSLKQHSHVHIKILEHLIDGSKNITELKNYTNITGGLDSYLNELVQAGFIEKDGTFGFEGLESKRYFYRLSDNYTRFYLKYILPKKNRIESNLYKNNNMLEQLPQWATIVGLQFENLVKQNKDLLFVEIGLNSSNIKNASGYIQRKMKKQQGLQIDYLIEDNHGNCYLCEFKFKNQIGVGVVNEVKKKIQKLQKKYKNIPSIRPVLVYCGSLSVDLSGDTFFTHKIDFCKFLK